MKNLMQNRNYFTCCIRGLIGIVALVAFAGCFGQPLTTREKGTLAGGAVGAGTGAVVGAAVGAPGAGAAIGGAVGAGAGLAMGNARQNQENTNATTRAALSLPSHDINSNHQQMNDLSVVE